MPLLNDRGGLRVLYTIISQYDVFTKETNGENVGKYINISGGKVEYIFSGKNKVVKSLFSTDPKMYLDKRYIPGVKL